MRLEPSNIVHLGEKLPTKHPAFFGYNRGAKILGFINSLLNIKVTRGGEDKVFLAQEGMVIQIKRNSESTGTGSGAWKGFYNPATEYNYGDIVQLTPTEAETYLDVDSMQVTVGGTYVWNNETPGTVVVPVHVLMPTYNSEQWVTISTYPASIDDCDSEGLPIIQLADAQVKPEVV